MKYFLILFITNFLIVLSSNAVHNCDSVFISEVIIKGNKKTKSNVIFRELEFNSLQNYNTVKLDSILFKSKKNLFNTALFNEVIVERKENENCESIVNISLNERWYIWPSPHFDIIDRNFNVWWKEYDHDLKRTVYGFHVDHHNLTGNNDKLRVKALYGWKKNFLLEYRTPYLDKNRSLRLKPQVEYTSKKNLIYNSFNNKEEFLQLNDIVWTKVKTGLIISKRFKFDIFHSLEVNFQRRSITDTIAVLNPDYLGPGLKKLNYLELYYKYEVLKTDIDYYPTKGYTFSFDFLKRGFGIVGNANQTRLRGNFSKYFQLDQNFSSVVNFSGQYNMNNNIPWMFKEGWGSYSLRGYELYLFNSLNNFMARAALRYHLLSFNINNPIFNIAQFEKIPFSVYFKVYKENGKVWDKKLQPTNNLYNKWLGGQGFGIDIISFYDLVLGIEYSFNNINEKQFILQFNFEY